MGGVVLTEEVVTDTLQMIRISVIYFCSRFSFEKSTDEAVHTKNDREISDILVACIRLAHRVDNMKEYSAGMIHVLRNECLKTGRGPENFSVAATANARRVLRAHENYAPTPLVRLDGMARRLGVRAVFVKDESKRFGLNAFKGLGGLYAIFCAVCAELGLDAEKITFGDLRAPGYAQKIRALTFITTTDGNHGRGIAWAAAQLGCRAYVFMPRASSLARAEAIRAFGAECTVTEAGYDDTVRMTSRIARDRGWFLIQDTSWEGYEKIPRWIMQGYTTMADEAAAQIEAQNFAATHVFLQAGVGAMAGAVMGYLADRWAGRPEFCVVEPENMACVYRSAQVGDGKPHAAVKTGETIMAGLNCGEPCPLAWPILRDYAGWFMKCHDNIAAYGMRLLAAPTECDSRIVSGESGAVTTGVLNFIARQKSCAELKNAMKLDENSVVLLFSTEGDTDPENYERIVHGDAFRGAEIF